MEACFDATLAPFQHGLNVMSSNPLMGFGVNEDDGNKFQQSVELVRQVVTFVFDALASSFATLGQWFEHVPGFKYIVQPAACCVAAVPFLAGKILSLPFWGINGFVSLFR